MTHLTGYVGKVQDNRIFLICKDNEGNTIQCPHVEIFKEQGLTAISYAGRQLKEPYKFLTQREIALFFNGLDTNRERLETPSEWREKMDKRHAELMKDPEYAKLFNEVMSKSKNKILH